MSEFNDAPDPYPERTPCLFEGCRLSMEEHHRLGRGYALEVSALRAKMNKPEELDLAEVPSRDLLAEITRRLEDGRARQHPDAG